jgi:NAD(P)-dependent dehydrogenase (short-subunit alcohol dehydrogenase family)
MSSNPLTPGQLAGKTAFVTGSSRGIGAETAGFLAEAGARVAINYRDKEARAEKVAAGILESGGDAIVVGADLTDYASMTRLRGILEDKFGGLDILVLNASGGMESGKGDDYAMRLNRDAQVNALETLRPLLHRGSRVVFITSHQAHFIRTVDTMPEYLPVALSKRAGEDALREMIPSLAADGIDFVVVSADMIEGTVTATLLDRSSPGTIEARKEAVGKLYNVDEFAAEIVSAAVDPVPADNTRLVGDTGYFGQ